MLISLKLLLFFFQELFETCMEFMKLEKIEYGGVKGKPLSTLTVQIFDEFNEKYKHFTEVTYDPLDPQDDVSIPSCRMQLCFNAGLASAMLTQRW